MHSYLSSTVKEKIRHHVMHRSQKRRPKKSIILFPDEKMPDYRLGLEKGVIGPKTECLFVERDAVKAEAIEASLDRVVPPGYRRPVVVKRNLPYVKLHGTYDFAWLDFYGSITESEFHWIKSELLGKMQAGSSLFVTQNTHLRGNNYLKRIKERLEGDEAEFRAVCRRHGVVDVKCWQCAVHPHVVAAQLVAMQRCVAGDIKFRLYRNFDVAGKPGQTMVLHEISR